MPLFQNSVLNKYLKNQNTARMQATYSNYAAYFHNPERQANIRAAKEEQFQEGFMRELIVNILGYTLNPEPNYNLTTELKKPRWQQKGRWRHPLKRKGPGCD